MNGKVLLVFEQVDNTSEVNIRALSTLLEKGEAVFRCKRAKDVKEQDLEWCSSCIAIRPSSLYAEKIAMALCDSGRPLIVLLDDDLLSLPKNHPNYWRNRYLKKCIKLSHAFISPNPLLLDDLTKANPWAKKCLLDAFVGEEDIKPIEPLGGSINIVYPAGRDHAELFELFVKPTLNELATRYGDSIVFSFIGVAPDLSGVTEKLNYKQVPLMPLEEYDRFMQSNHFDIGIAPLENSYFSNRKYFIKFIEFAKNGIIGLYSKCIPYTLVVEEGKNGFLVDATPRDWYEKLCYVIDNIVDCKAIAAESQEVIKSRFTINNVLEKFKSVLPEVFLPTSSLRPIRYRVPVISRVIYDVKLQAYRVRHRIIKVFSRQLHLI